MRPLYKGDGFPYWTRRVPFAVNLRNFFLLAAAVIATSSSWAEIEWEPVVYPKDELYPSMIFSTATLKPGEDVFAKWAGHVLGQENGVVGVSIDGLKSGDMVRVEVKPNAVMEGGVFEGKIPKRADTWKIFPNPKFRFDALLSTKQATPLSVTFKVSVNDKDLGEQTRDVTLQTINDCMFAVSESDEEGDVSDYSWLFAAYVNENHPWIDGILREALDTGIVSSFDGYQSGDPAVVADQVFAIWHVLQERGFRYSDITTTATDSDDVARQHVRLFDDAIKARQANCVDGSVLMASILRKIGLNPYLVSIPGHMFLAVDLDEEGEKTIAIETTMMGEKADEASEGVDWISKKDLKVRRKAPGWFAFEAAVQAGNEELNDAWDKLEDPKEMDYQIIDIAEARKMGIIPISYREPSK
ncbi:hypothetical protein TSACC_21514 [Terrimicrobium sacchariphilum]|uniref:Transglutaminase-like superfamily protein n=1 Tax=Terrimicrobium sacchariphilum TaxID=690879 RepID=A0A146G5S1_TERSA|nr:hypothetical protein TSACC_21514 [Terrimicrobium sacchariphilum]